MLFKVSSKLKFKVQVCVGSPHVQTVLKRLKFTHEDNACVPVQPKVCRHSEEGSCMNHTYKISNFCYSKITTFKFLKLQFLDFILRVSISL
jgi:hypothetical protein